MKTAAHRPTDEPVAGRRSARALLRHGAALVAGAAALLLFQPAPSLAPPGAHAESLADGVEERLLDLTNADRGRNGLAPVAFDPTLLKVARARAAAQLGRETLSHYDATGDVAMADLLADSGVSYLLAGENLARWIASDPAASERVEQAWMGSPTHRRNILEPSFNRLAVGAAADDSGRVAFAQIFRAAP
jgi:uncharacterized protein YkwD